MSTVPGKFGMMFVVSPYSDKILYKEKGSLSPLGTIVSAEELVVVVNGILTHSLQPTVVCSALEVLVAVVEWCVDIFRCRSRVSCYSGSIGS